MTSDSTSLDFLAGGGRMGELIRAMDWTHSSLGPPAQWPSSLRTTLSLCLASNFPLCFIWGPERVQFYNDGYWPLCADKHPGSMGQDYKQCWASAWPVIGPNFERCIEAGETTFVTDARMLLDRSGYLEETFFTYSYSPIRDESGALAGVFHPVTETTHLVLAERRLLAVRAVSDAAATATSVEDVLQRMASSLSGHALDLPFVMVYVTDAAAPERAELRSTTGVSGTGRAVHAVVQLGDPSDVWCLEEARLANELVELTDLADRGKLFDEVDGAVPHSAVVCPVSLVTGAAASVFLVAGVSPRRALDDGYRAFFAMLRDAVGSAVAKAHSYAEARRRAEALAALDRAKTDFFSNVSHEFRTPLTLMLGPLDRLLGESGAGFGAEAREQLEIARRNGYRLLKLVSTLLEFSRTETGRAQAVFRPTDVCGLTVHLCSMFRSTIEHAGMSFEVHCEPLPRPTYVDRDMWETLVLNLLSNAFKFTLQGRIAVTLQPCGEAWELRVQDTGAGIPPDELPRIFERFHRVRGAVGRTFEGTGIGLALVKDLVQLHGGSISAQSAPDVGTTFTVRLPYGAAHLPAAQVDENAADSGAGAGALTFLNEMGAWSGRVDPEPAGDEPVEASMAVVKALDSDRPVVLVVDDNADMRAYIRSVLASEHALKFAGNGAEALTQVRLEAPDLVLTDVMMPVLDGFGLLHALRGDAATRAIPVIMLSARAGDEASVEGLEAGADDYLVKPFGALELKARVRNHIELGRLRRELAERDERQRGVALRDLQARVFDTALSNTADFVYTFDLAGRFTYVNRALLALWGKRLDEAVGRNFFELDYPPELAERLQRQIQQVIDTRSVVRDETDYTSAAGSRDYEYIFVPVISPAGDVVAVSGSTRDITDQRQALQLLRENDRKKDEFLAMLAHELRNPLAAVSNAVAVLKMSNRPQSVGMATDIIQRQVRQFARLIDDLLDVSRITSGKITLQRELVDAASVVKESVAAMQPMMEQHRHTLEVDLPTEPLLVRADSTRLQQVVINLLSNAAKYTPRGGRIRVEVRHADDEVVIAVVDNGMGMMPDKIASMFDLFTQGERSIDRSEGGLGVGLTIVRKLVELHGGRITGDSEGPGRGSRFEVRLPAAHPPSSARPGDTELALEPGALRVLVVDDNVDAAESLVVALTLMGYEAESVFDGPSALAAAQERPWDVMLLDIGLPGMDGYEVSQRLAADASRRPKKVIALSGYGQAEDKRRSAAAGMDHHLVKPVDLKELLSLFKPASVKG